MKRFSSTVLALGLALLTMAVPALARDGQGWGRMGERLQAELNLTQEQMSQLQPLFEEQRARHKARREAMKAQLDGVLTAEQKSRLEALKTERKAQGGERRGPGARGQGAGFGKLAEKLGLTAEQQAQLQQLREKSRQEWQAEREAFQARLAQVLTPEQQARWEQLKQQRHQRRSKGPQGPARPQQG